MNNPKDIFWSTDLNEDLSETILKNIPLKDRHSATYLKDIIHILIQALEQGQLTIDINNHKPSDKLINKGWPQEHIKALSNSGWLEIESSPIVLKKDELSFKRWHIDVESILDNLRGRVKNSLIEQDSLPINFPQELDPKQKAAVLAVRTENIILLSGGPGTGKTSTIIQMLIIALDARPDLRIGLSAPTGKAARRLKDTINEGIAKSKVSYAEKLSLIPCTTLHRWLQSSKNKFGKNKRNPLLLDLLVIDEMSMVDLRIATALLEALPNTSQLILVGDPAQLKPIGSCSIWDKLQEEDIKAFFGAGVVELTKLYRNRGDLAYLAKAIRTEGINSFSEKLLKLNTSSNVKLYRSNPDSIPKEIIKQLLDHKSKLKTLAEITRIELPKSTKTSSLLEIDLQEGSKKLLKTLESQMVLCPRNHGLWGVSHIHKLLLGVKDGEKSTNWEEGTPVICNENQPELGLSNGDLGVIIGEGRDYRILFRVFSEKQESVIRLIHPARLKEIKPAFAITIHKAQGSESNKVILFWPYFIKQKLDKYPENINGEDYQKRMLYTAITRAKENLTILINN